MRPPDREPSPEPERPAGPTPGGDPAAGASTAGMPTGWEPVPPAAGAPAAGPPATVFRGRALVYGDDITTDAIAPGKYLKLPLAELVPHVMEGVDPGFTQKVRPGDILVAGRNFGSGSSRENAPAALKAAGIACVVARFFARIFFRNAINLGLPAVECAEAGRIQPWDEIEVRLEEGQIVNLTRGETYEATRLPAELLELVRAGGLVPWLEWRLAARQEAARPGSGGAR